MKRRFAKRQQAREKRKLARWDRRWRGLHTYYADQAKLIAVIEEIIEIFGAAPNETDDEFLARVSAKAVQFGSRGLLNEIVAPLERRVTAARDVRVVPRGKRFDITLTARVPVAELVDDPPNENGPPAPLPGGQTLSREDEDT